MTESRDYQLDGIVTLGLWNPETIIEQTFVASHDNLSRIDFRVDSYHPWNSPYLECRLYEILTDENPQDISYEYIKEQRREIRHDNMNGWAISGHMFNAFTFAPIPDSKGKRYIVSIQSPGLKQDGIAAILLASQIDRYLYSGNLFENGEKRGGDLSFRLLYVQPRITLLRKSIAKLTLQKPAIFSVSATYYLLFFGYIGLFLIVIGMLIRLKA